MCEFKVGDEVYFTTYNLNYYESFHGVIIRFEQSIDPKKKIRSDPLWAWKICKRISCFS